MVNLDTGELLEVIVTVAIDSDGAWWACGSSGDMKLEFPAQQAQRMVGSPSRVFHIKSYLPAPKADTIQPRAVIEFKPKEDAESPQGIGCPRE